MIAITWKPRFESVGTCVLVTGGRIRLILALTATQRLPKYLHNKAKDPIEEVIDLHFYVGKIQETDP